MNQEQQDLECIQQIRSGGKRRAEGITTLYRKYAPQLKHFFFRRGKTKEQAEDLLHEVFIQIIRQIDSYRGEGAFSAWMWTIARNTLISDFRKNERHLTDADLDESLAQGERATLPNDLVQDALTDCVQQAFLQFRQHHEEQAQALTLIVFHGWDIEEISRFLGRTQGATREYLSQSRKKLHPFLEPCYEYLVP